jgi:hypothetical protein
LSPSVNNEAWRAPRFYWEFLRSETVTFDRGRAKHFGESGESSYDRLFFDWLRERSRYATDLNSPAQGTEVVLMEVLQNPTPVRCTGIAHRIAPDRDFPVNAAIAEVAWQSRTLAKPSRSLAKPSRTPSTSTRIIATASYSVAKAGRSRATSTRRSATAGCSVAKAGRTRSTRARTRAKLTRSVANPGRTRSMASCNRATPGYSAAGATYRFVCAGRIVTMTVRSGVTARRAVARECRFLSIRARTASATTSVVFAPEEQNVYSPSDPNWAAPLGAGM